MMGLGILGTLGSLPPSSSGGGGSTFDILTESGDPITTEAGSRLETENGP